MELGSLLDKGISWVSSGLTEMGTSRKTVNVQEEFDKAKLAYNLKDYETAEEKFRDLLQLHRDEMTAYGQTYAAYYIAECACSREELVESKRYFEIAAELSQTQTDVTVTLNSQLRLGHLNSLLGRYDAALAVLEKSSKIGRKAEKSEWYILPDHSMSWVHFSLGAVAVARTTLEACLLWYREGEQENRVAAACADLGSMVLPGGEYEQEKELLKEAWRQFKKDDDKSSLAEVADSIGRIAIYDGDLDKARRSYSLALNVRRSQRYRKRVAHMLEGVSALELKCGNPFKSARLIGAADEIRAKLHCPLAPVREPEYEACIHEVCGQIGHDAFVRACRVGRAMGHDEVLAYAVSE